MYDLSNYVKPFKDSEVIGRKNFGNKTYKRRPVKEVGGGRKRKRLPGSAYRGNRPERIPRIGQIHK